MALDANFNGTSLFLTALVYFIALCIVVMYSKVHTEKNTLPSMSWKDFEILDEQTTQTFDCVKLGVPSPLHMVQ